MIVVDTSAIVAMLFNEADAHLYGKALALEDEHGARLVIVTLDLIGVPVTLESWR